MNFIDLGLPSGTLWAESNEEGLHTFDEAVSKYGDSLPTYEQFEELQTQCQWKWNGSGYDVTGPNGNTIVLPAEGFRDYNSTVHCVGSYGSYWSSTPDDLDFARGLDFDASSVDVGNYKQCYGETVRLVKIK